MENVAEKLSNLSTEDTFRTKAKAMAMLLLDECYNTAASDAATFSQKVEFLKTAAKLGDLEPRQQNSSPVAQVGFSIKVVYNNDSPEVDPPRVSTADVVDVSHEPDWLSLLPEYIDARTLWRTRTLSALSSAVGAKPDGAKPISNPDLTRQSPEPR